MTNTETTETPAAEPKPLSLWGQKFSKYVQPSPYASDGGELIGRNPADIPVADLRALGGSPTPIKAIRAKCLDCSGYSDAEVRKCTAIKCALWPFRMGRNPFFGKADQGARDVASSKVYNGV